MNKHTGRWNEWSSQWVLEQCVRHGMTEVVICPGSRSTPLALAASKISELTIHTHFDERGAAFFALGLERASERPVAWITTSGTAVANGLPAVVEASQSRVPLILLTADRPPELRGCGANQAIDQVNIFGNYCRYFKDLSLSNPDMTQGWYEGEVNRAFTAAHQSGNEGPVHLNLMIREPFRSEDGDGGTTARRIEPDLAFSPDGPELSPSRLSALTQHLESAKEGLLVIGGLRTQKEKTVVSALAKKLGWPCVADVTSGLRFSEDIPSLISHIDLLLLHENVRWTQPDVVLWIGGPVVSKRLLEWLGRESRSKLIRISSNHLQEDPLHRAVSFDVGDLASITSQIESITLPELSKQWVDRWRKADALIASELSQPDLMRDPQMSQLEIARLVSDLREVEYGIFVGNSLPIRELDQVGVGNSRIQYLYANRGASGIDGLIASAAGIALRKGIPSLAFIGDLSFLHDANSLVLLRKIETPFVLLVVNNDGGGIFHFLPALQNVRDFESLFAVPHGADFAHAAELFGLPFERPESLPDLRQALNSGLATPGPKIIEVKTSREQAQEAFVQLTATIQRLPLK